MHHNPLQAPGVGTPGAGGLERNISDEGNQSRRRFSWNCRQSMSSTWNRSKGLPTPGKTITLGPVGTAAQALRSPIMRNSRTRRLATAHLLLSWGGRQDLPPLSGALLDIRVVGLRGVAIVPVLGRGRRGFDINPGRRRNNNGWIGIGLPIWPPVGSEGHDDARADEDPRRSMPMAFMPIASMSMPLVPMPTTVGVPWHRTD
jgi:hypothetical protein